MKSPCGLKGLLSFLILWLVNRQPLTGAEIASELGRRRGTKPTPGTIYPALAELVKRGALRCRRERRSKRYFITPTGKKALEKSLVIFCKAFRDVLTSTTG